MLWSAARATWPWLASGPPDWVELAVMVPTLMLLTMPWSSTLPSAAAALTVPEAEMRTGAAAVPMLPEAVRWRSLVVIWALLVPWMMLVSAFTTPVPELPATMVVVPFLLRMGPLMMTFEAELTLTAPLL